MPSLKTQRRLASKILKVGLDRVVFDPEKIDEIKEAITRTDIRELIKEGAIKKLPKKGIKRRAGRKRQIAKRKGRRRREGSIKKKIKERKRAYVILIRNLREYLRNLKKRNIINRKEYRLLRKLAKSGLFKDKKSLVDYIRMKLKKEL